MLVFFCYFPSPRLKGKSHKTDEDDKQHGGNHIEETRSFKLLDRHSTYERTDHAPEAEEDPAHDIARWQKLFRQEVGHIADPEGEGRSDGHPGKGEAGEEADGGMGNESRRRETAGPDDHHDNQNTLPSDPVTQDPEGEL